VASATRRWVGQQRQRGGVFAVIRRRAPCAGLPLPASRRRPDRRAGDVRRAAAGPAAGVGLLADQRRVHQAALGVDESGDLLVHRASPQ
jgi:hypothetical protein